MNRNLGNFDRLLRVIGAVILAALAYTGVLAGGLAIAGIVVAVILFVTAVAGFCPAYRLLGVKTCKAPR